MSVGQFGICCCSEDEIPEEEEMESLLVQHPSDSYATGRLAQLDWSMVPPKLESPPPPRVFATPLRNGYSESYYYAGGGFNPPTVPELVLTTADGEVPEPGGGYHFDGFWKPQWHDQGGYDDPPRVYIDPLDQNAANYTRLLYQRLMVLGQAGWVVAMPQSVYLGSNLDAQNHCFARRSRFRVTYSAPAWNATADMVWTENRVSTNPSTGKKLTYYNSPRLSNVRLLSQFTTVPLQWYEASPSATGYANARCVFYVIEESTAAWQSRTGYQFVP